MQKIYNSREITEMEQMLLSERTDWESASELLSHKAIAVCNRLKQDFYALRRVVIFAGPHSKGALAIRVGQSLVGMQYEVEVVLLNPNGTLPEEVACERDSYLEVSSRLTEVTGNSFEPPVIGESDLLIDGIQEAALLPSLNNVIKYLNGLKAVKVALEMPSGMSDQSEGVVDYTKIFKSQVTYTFYSPKLLFLLPENEPYVGQWRVLYPSFYTPKAPAKGTYLYFSTLEMERLLPARQRFSNKYDYGKDLLIAGSQGMMGAAILAARAAMVSGAGHLTVHVPEGQSLLMHSMVPEALVQEDSSEEGFSSAIEGLMDYNAIAVGPGLGRSMESLLALEQLLQSYRPPMVIDADALYLLAEEGGRLLEMVPKGSILTPHTGEFDRLFGPSRNSLERLEKCRNRASQLGLYIVLKGAFTAIGTPSGQLIFTMSGNPGLATAGTGDVLTGMILALVGQKIGQLEACLAATFIHGFAAESYCGDYCELSLTASKLVEYLPMAYKRFTSHSPNSPLL